MGHIMLCGTLLMLSGPITGLVSYKTLEGTLNLYHVRSEVAQSKVLNQSLACMISTSTSQLSLNIKPTTSITPSPQTP